MPLYRPQELLAFLQEENLAPKKGLSQNFLIDGNIVRKIVELAEIRAGDLVLEVGPGPGVFTEELLKSGARVVAVEKDRGFAEKLKRLEGPLTVIEGDILETDLEKLLESPVKMVSNLPFHITTPILAKILSTKNLFSRIVIIVQDEVARRFTAVPRTKDYSRITLFISFFANVRYAFKVKKSCFMPMPKVDSAVVVIEPKTPPLENEKDFLELVKMAFSQRRKTIKAALHKKYPKELVEDALKKANLSITARAEELTLHDFLNLFRALSDEQEE